MPQRNLFTLVVSIIVALACYHQAARGRYAYVVSQVMDTVSRHYVDPVPRRALLRAAIQGITSELDPYSNYIPPRDYQYFQEILEQEFGGVGVEIGIDPETRQLMVVSPLPHTPAFEAGLRAGDAIVAIEGSETRGMTMEEAMRRMRGLPGEPVRLTVRHAGQTDVEELVIHRAIIQVDSVLGDSREPDGSWNYRLREDPRIALVRVVTFGDRTGEELAAALRSIHGAEALVLDLRGNAGGLLSAAVDVVNLFLSKGTIVSIRYRDPDDTRVIEASPESTLIPPGSMPIVVLINEGSASASEIVAAALQDQGIADIGGERSFGKGTVQNLFRLPGRSGALKLTIATYQRPSGKNIHRREGATEEDTWGVIPDPPLAVPLTPEQREALWEARHQRDIYRPGSTGEVDMLEADPQLRKAVEYLDAKLRALPRPRRGEESRAA